MGRHQLNTARQLHLLATHTHASLPPASAPARCAPASLGDAAAEVLPWGVRLGERLALEQRFLMHKGRPASAKLDLAGARPSIHTPSEPRN